MTAGKILVGRDQIMARRYCYKDVLPFTAMATIICANIGLNVLFKAATLKGMSYYIFITYSHAIGTLLLLPISFMFPRTAVLSPLKLHIFFRLFLLGLLGFLAQICAYKGIEYSSPTLASAISNLSPAFTFILAVIFRLERVALRSSTSQAKILGTIASILGALLIVLYKGPKVFSSPHWTSSSVSHKRSMESSESNWVIGGTLLAAAYLLFAFWTIIQAQVMQMYPTELIVTFFYNLFAAVISIPVSLIAESNLSSWRLRPSVAVIAVLYSGVFSCFGTIVNAWCLHMKGPIYVANFSPLSIAIAAFMSAIFLGDSLYLGSIVGAIIISMGFYAVIWGTAKEEQMIEDDSGISKEEKSEIGMVQQEQGALSQEALFDSAVESTIKELLSLNLANIGSAMFKIQARILDIDTLDGWYYPSCPICTTSMTPELDAFYCKEHQRQPPHLMMKLSLYIGDNTAKTKAIIFGTLAEKMTNISVVGMPILGDISSVRIPNIVETILNKEYNFVVGLSDQAFRQELLNYKIFAYKAINETQPNTSSD